MYTLRFAACDGGACNNYILLSGLVRLIVSVANGSLIEVAYAFCEVKFNILAQNEYFQLKLWFYPMT